MIKALINWMGLKKPQKLLDPFVGSGTALIEAKTMDINGIGIDINPVARMLVPKFVCGQSRTSLFILHSVRETCNLTLSHTKREFRNTLARYNCARFLFSVLSCTRLQKR